MRPGPLPAVLGRGYAARDMTDHTFAAETPLRLAVLDRDSGFLQVLTKRLDRLGWEYRITGSAVPLDTIVGMRLSAGVGDLAGPGAPGGEWREGVCSELPGLGVVVCTSQSTVAQRVRGLRLGADDWLAKPCHPEELIARVEAVVRRRQRAGDTAPDPVAVGEIELLPG